MFVTEYRAMVALAAAVSGSRAHAEDIAQEAMSRLDANWERVHEYSKPGAWLRRVTINLAISQKRRRLSEAKALLRLKRSEPTIAPAQSRDVDVWRAVAELPRQQRAAIALQFLEDRSMDEIAEILEIAPATVRVHLHRARATLREALTPPTPASRQEQTR